MAFPVKEDSNGVRRVILDHNGRVQKLASLAASFASVRFNHHLATALAGDKELSDRKVGRALFDARIFNVAPGQTYLDAHPEATEEERCGNVELGNNLLWRYRDCVKNSKSAFAMLHFSSKQLHKLTSDQMVDKVLLEKGLDWNALEPWKKYGLSVKRQPNGEAALEIHGV